MIDAIIIDDEAHCIRHLTELLNSYYSGIIRINGAFQTLEDGREAIARLQPDLVFLDIQLGDESGFELLKHLPVVQFDVIFVTAFDRYAVQAFKFSAVDYLLKPVDPDDLGQAVARLEQKRSKQEIAQKFETLFHNLKTSPALPKRICVPTVKELLYVPVNEIIRCESHINYTSLFLTSGRKLTVAKTLKEFEELLSEHHFYRIHNSHLINLACIRSYNKGKGGTVSMTDNTEIVVSTRRKDELLKRLAEG